MEKNNSTRMENTNQITIAFIDDHVLLRSQVCEMFENIDGFRVLFQAENGEIALKRIFEDKLLTNVPPHL